MLADTEKKLMFMNQGKPSTVGMTSSSMMNMGPVVEKWRLVDYLYIKLLSKESVESTLKSFETGTFIDLLALVNVSLLVSRQQVKSQDPTAFQPGDKGETIVEMPREIGHSYRPAGGAPCFSPKLFRHPPDHLLLRAIHRRRSPLGTSAAILDVANSRRRFILEVC